MKSYRQQRVEDFERRAAYSPASVYLHRSRGWRDIPVHNFADESPDGVADVLDCWCLLGSDSALLECSTVAADGRPAGLYALIDAEPPHYPKLHAVLAMAGITRAAEAAMQRFVELGFPDGPRFQLQPGGD